ncbi:type III-B CRISPR module RAMP protein Cmr4 [Nocardiopsis alba]|uniref:type III-B CRISPR module RAMP protein Cmr4 n=1 Tax=Nocardiopsis alba TaxID=53437 RepID=UPI00366F1F37
MTEFVVFLCAESPLHAGASDSEGVIDLPIQREVHTRYPTVYGQSLKGAWRQAAEERVSYSASGSGARWKESDVHALFGSPVSQRQATTPGLVSVGDAQLVALPVPTLQRTFAWATSSLALSRLARKYKTVGITVPAAVPTNPAEAVATDTDWSGRQALGPLVLDVHATAGEQSRLLAEWARRISTQAFDDDAAFEWFSTKFARDLVLVDGEAMTTLVQECTEVSVRVQLNENKTVANGPFHSEYLPAETVLACSLHLRPAPGRTEVDQHHVDLLRDLLHGSGCVLHRIGGDETLGKGLVWTRLASGEG